jgi:TolB-like protein/tetratricopeptide (TPR) repeat protein
MPENATPPGSEGSPPSGKMLDSWGEIAAYFSREVRTVQRWEKFEGLPIHRHGHSKKSTVYAYASELDAWFKKRQPMDDPEADAKFVPEPDPDPAADKPEDAEPTSSRTRLPFLIVAGALLLGYFGHYGYVKLREKWAEPVSTSRTRLVVMPFSNLNGDSTAAEITSGLTDVITTQLGQLAPDRISVIAPSSAKPFVGKPLNQIKSGLNVAYVLEGTVHHVDSQVRVNIRLLQTSDETEVAADSFTRPFANVLELENVVAEKVGRVILTTLPIPLVVPARPGNVSDEAASRSNEAFLKAVALWTARSDLKRSIDLFDQATKDNPYNAQAFAGLAAATALYGQVPNDGLLPSIAKPAARSAAERALQLNPGLAEPHAVLGNVAMSYDWDFAASEKEFKTAIRINSNYPTAHEWYAHLLMVQGRYEEALAESQKVLDLEPATPLFHVVRAEILYYARRYDESIAETTTVIQQHPEFLLAYYWKGCALREQKKLAEAIALFDHVRQLTGGAPFMVMAYGHAQALAGNRAEARKSLAILASAKQSRPIPDIYSAAIYVGLGEKDNAFAALDRDLANRVDRLVYTKVDPMSDPIRSDPRFAQLLAKMGIQ